MIDDNIQVRVGDFGLAFFADAGTASMGSHSGGAARWMAPELLKSIISRLTTMLMILFASRKLTRGLKEECCNLLCLCVPS